MSVSEDFRKRVEGFLSELRTRSYIPINKTDATPEEKEEYFCVRMHQEIAAEGLLDKAPVRPLELREICNQIRELPMVREIVGDGPNVGYPHHLVCQRDLSVLMFKLQEMLDYLPEPTLPLTIPPSPPRNSRGPQADMEKHKSIANAVALYGNDWRRRANIEKIVAQLDREKVPVSKSWPKRKPSSARTWKTALMYFEQDVVKTIDYSRRMAHRKNQSP